MLAIAHLCKEKNWLFSYITKSIPAWIKSQNKGNLALALSLGMKLIEVDSSQYQDTINWHKNNNDRNTLFIPQGGAFKEAKIGIEILSFEINRWFNKQNLKKLHIFTPSGTGTTALYLQKYLSKNIKVYTTPSVGNSLYLKEQWQALNEKKEPIILETKKKYHFGKLYKDFLDIQQSLEIEFDLLYAPKMWIAILENIEQFNNEPMLYIHSGGVSGNETLLDRYQRKFN
jgi:1-aminocyclopropane-1-carboxylate deaminase/D-cysteine desulfhydrase-like pyridoxal-dependent ACC family enzyme